MFFFFLSQTIPYQCQNKQESEIPIVIIHGTLNNAAKMKTVKSVIENSYPNRKIIVTDAYLMITSFFDNGNRLASFTMDQVFNGVNKLAGNSTSNPYTCIDLVGHSQGGFMARLYTQLYAGKATENGNFPAVRRIISLAGVQAGFHCPSTGPQRGVSKFCKGLQGIPDSWIRSRLMSWFFTALTYFRDPRLPEMVAFSVNNVTATSSNLHPALEPKSVSDNIWKKLVYHTNVLGEGREKIEDLEFFAAFGSDSDKTLSPWQTSIFGFFQETGRNSGSDGSVAVPMTETSDYILNTYGLFTLNQATGQTKRLIRRQTANMSHIAFRDDPVFIEKCVIPLLANKSIQDILNQLDSSDICGKEPTEW